MSRKKGSKIASLPLVEPNAAGADIGATQMFVAVPADRDAEPVRCFDTFTADLERLADWLEHVRSAPWRWSQPVCTGFRCTRFWKRMESDRA